MKWGAVKQARQQNTRLKAKGVHTDAQATFEAALEAIKQNKAMSRAQKSAANERAAKQFMRSGMNTVTNINERAERMKSRNKYSDKYLSELQASGNTKAIADYLDASQNQRDIMLSRHFAYGATKQIADIQAAKGLSTSDFYKMNHMVAVYASKGEKSPDQIADYITKLTEKAENGTL